MTALPAIASVGVVVLAGATIWCWVTSLRTPFMPHGFASHQVYRHPMPMQIFCLVACLAGAGVLLVLALNAHGATPGASAVTAWSVGALVAASVAVLAALESRYRFVAVSDRQVVFGLRRRRRTIALADVESVLRRGAHMGLRRRAGGIVLLPGGFGSNRRLYDRLHLAIAGVPDFPSSASRGADRLGYAGPVDLDRLLHLDPDRPGPWTFFAFPTSMLDEHGLPDHLRAQELLALLQKEGIAFGIWTPSFADSGSTYAATPSADDRTLVVEAIARLEHAGRIAENEFTTFTEALHGSPRDT